MAEDRDQVLEDDQGYDQVLRSSGEGLALRDGINGKDVASG